MLRGLKLHSASATGVRFFDNLKGAGIWTGTACERWDGAAGQRSRSGSCIDAGLRALKHFSWLGGLGKMIPDQEPLAIVELANDATASYTSALSTVEGRWLR